MEKSIEERLSELEATSLQEINDKIFSHEIELNEAAHQALNQIHWILKIESTNKNIVKKVQEVMDVYHKKGNEGLSLFIKKRQKESYDKDPVAYKEFMEEAREMSERFKKEDEKNN